MASRIVCVIGVLALAAGCSTVWAQNVKITPLGSHAGELCSRDRATIFEDPTGVRILYDSGQSVTGGDDARLGTVDVVLLSHAHGDHIGDQKMKALEAGTCDNPEVVSAAPNSTTAEIAAAKNAAIVMIVPLANFIGRKVETIRGKPTGTCPQNGNDLVVPFAAPCLATVQTGGTRRIKTANATQAVEITTVPAAHDSTVPRELLGEAARKSLEREPNARAAEWLRDSLHQWTDGVSVRRHRDTRRNEVGRRRLFQSESDGAECRPERSDVERCGLHRQRACPARRGDRLARQRGCNHCRQGSAELTHCRLHVARDRSAGLSCAERQDDAVQW